MAAMQLYRESLIAPMGRSCNDIDESIRVMTDTCALGSTPYPQAAAHKRNGSFPPMHLDRWHR